jgi:hypothetical protein
LNTTSERRQPNASIDGIKDWQMQQHLIGGKWTLTEAFHQALMLEAAKAAAKPSVRLQVIRAEAPTEHNCEEPNIRLGDWYTGSLGMSDILEETVDGKVPRGTA